MKRAGMRRECQTCLQFSDVRRICKVFIKPQEVHGVLTAQGVCASYTARFDSLGNIPVEKMIRETKARAEMGRRACINAPKLTENRPLVQ